MYICKVINKEKEIRFIPEESDSSTTTGLSFALYQQLADEVDSGLWGSGNVRRTRLEEAGYVYDAVQTIVNHMYPPCPPIDMSYFDASSTRSLSLASSNESDASNVSDAPVLRAVGDSNDHPTNLDFDTYREIADQVVMGRWGYMPERQERLEAAGYYYPAVQTIVNNMMDSSLPINMSYFSASSDDPVVDPDEPTPDPVTPSGYKKKEVEVYKEHIFHYAPANDKNMTVLSGKITNEFNRAGTFEFQLPPSNTCLKNNRFSKLTSIIEVYWSEDAEPIFRGRILDSQKSFAGTMTFKCEGMMSALNDTVVRPDVYANTFGGDQENGVVASVSDMFTTLINDHNTQIADSSSYRYFTRIDVQGYSASGVHFQYPNYENTLEYIQNNLLGNEEVGGRMWIDDQTIHLYADVAELQTVSEQPIVFGRNLFDLTQNVNAAELYTVIIPTGKDGLMLNGSDHIENAEAVARYGKIWHHEEFSDVEDPGVLATKATETLNRNIQEVMSIEMSALDLHILDFNQKALKIGTYIPVLSPPHGIDVSYICTAASIDICNPANTKYTLGVSPETLTTKQMKLSNSFTQNSLYYKSESSKYPIALTVAGGKVQIISHTFYRAGSVVYLSFTAKFLTDVNADTSTVIFTFDTYNNPPSPATGNGYNQTTNKNCYIRVNNGQISVESSTAIAINNVVTCSMTWTRA